MEPEGETDLYEQEEAGHLTRVEVAQGSLPARLELLGLGLGALLFAGLLVFLPVRRTAILDLEPASGLRLTIASLHLPLLLAFLGFLVRSSQRASSVPRSPVARAAWGQLMWGLFLLAASWLCLYGWMVALWSGAPGGEWAGARGLALADLLNTLGSVAFFYLYLVLDKPSVPAHEDPGRDVEFRRSLLAVAGICALSGLLSMLGRLGYFQLSELGPLLGSFVAAIAMMYFFGQFDYRYMRVPRWMIAPLYLYVAIQVAWHEIAAKDGEAWYPNALLVTALVLKAYLLGILCLWIHRKTLQKYLDFASL